MYAPKRDEETGDGSIGLMDFRAILAPPPVNNDVIMEFFHPPIPPTPPLPRVVRVNVPDARSELLEEIRESYRIRTMDRSV